MTKDGANGSRTTGPWPSANAYSAAIQNPRVSFADEALRGATAATDALGMPLVASGNFAYVYKLKLADGTARAVKCFRQFLGDRQERYETLHAQLNAALVPCLASFDYDASGIRIAGRTFPVLVMEWLEGNTLDVHLAEVLRSPGSADVIRGVAAEWASLVAQIEDAGLAHGDLQHGNVILTSVGVRLVDLDGMFVPASRGRRAPEVGHQHYQHPARTSADFDERLDRFSVLAIHVSLLALAEDPTLWRDFHDDNLLFVRADFLRPAASPLFARLRARGGEVARLAKELEDACAGPPRDCPSLGSLVSIQRSRLPAWMQRPTSPIVAVASREGIPGQIRAATPPPTSPPRPVAPIAASLSRYLPTSAFPSRVSARPVTPVPPPPSPFTFELGSIPWVRSLAFLTWGSLQVRWSTGAILFALAGVIAASFRIRAYVREGRNWPLRGPWNPPRKRSGWTGPSASASSPTGAPYVASNRTIFHHSSCKLVRRFRPQMRFHFSTPAEARANGLRWCRVCRP